MTSSQMFKDRHSGQKNIFSKRLDDLKNFIGSIIITLFIAKLKTFLRIIVSVKT